MQFVSLFYLQLYDLNFNSNRSRRRTLLLRQLGNLKVFLCGPNIITVQVKLILSEFDIYGIEFA